MADTITEVPSTVDVESNPQTTNNEPSITTNDNDTSKATDHSNSDEIRSVREIAKTTHIDFTTVGDDNGEEDYDDNEDDDYDEPPAQNINPLNHAQDDMEMETIRNSYKNSESDFTSIDSEESSLSSPSSSKRVTMFQTGPLPDDFLLSATLAIRTSILAGDSKRRFLDEGDFQSTRKYRISMAGDKKSEIKDFAPVVFSHIRKLYGISMQSYLMSWSDDKLIKKKATGKSDALFVHSPDGKYILKTIPKAEASRLRKILMEYYQHLETCPDSLMSKIFGLHRVTRRRGMPKIYFAIFNNVFDAPNSVNEIFDLKGSSVGRKACAGERVMKDLDLGDRQRIHLAPKAKTQILEQIAADCKFLAKLELMDYSLLVGIRRVSDKEPSELNTSRSQPLDQRLPGLLFFLESTKSVEVQQKKQTRVPSFRRKSMTLGKPIFASMDDLRNEIDELDISQNTAFNMGLSNYHESPELSTTPDLISDVSSPDEKDQQDAQDDNATTTHLSQLRKIAVSTPNLVGPGRQGSLPVQSRSVPALKGVLKRGASESCRLVTSSSTPNMNTRQDANGIYINEPPMRIPFYQQDDGGLRSSKQKEEGNAEFYEIYHFGIIDFLQKYNKKKKFANFAKSLKYEKEALSTVDPTFYMNRFLKMAEKVVGTNT